MSIANNRNFIIRINPEEILVVFFSIFILIVFTWLVQDDLLVLYGDEASLVYQTNNIEKNLDSVWDTVFNLGRPNINIANLFPQIFFVNIAKSISETDFQKLLFGLYHCIHYFSFYFASRYLFNVRPAVAASFGFFYILNYFTIVSYANFNIIIQLTVIPLIVCLTSIRNISTFRAFFLTTTGYFFIGAYLFQTLSNPPIVLACILLGAICLIGFKLLERDYCLSNQVLVVALSAVVFFVVFGEQVLDLYRNLTSIADTKLREMDGSIFSQIRGYGLTTFLNLIQGKGYWAANLQEENYSYLPIYFAMGGDSSIISGFLVFLILFSIYLVISNIDQVRSGRGFIYVVLLIFVFFIFLAKGNTPPFGDIFRFGYENWTFGPMFRDPYAKFGPFVLFSTLTLVMVAFDMVLNRLKFGRSGSYLTLVCSSVFISSMASKVLNTDDHGVMRSALVEIPEYWDDTIRFLDGGDHQTRIALFPPMMGGSHVFEKGISTAIPLVPMLGTRDVVMYPGFTSLGGNSDKLQETLFDLISWNGSAFSLASPDTIKVESDISLSRNLFWNLVSVLAISDLVIQWDSNWINGGLDGLPPSYISNAFQRLGVLGKARQYTYEERYPSASNMLEKTIHNSTQEFKVFNEQYAKKVNVYRLVDTEPYLSSAKSVCFYGLDLPSFIKRLTTTKPMPGRVFVPKDNLGLIGDQFTTLDSCVFLPEVDFDYSAVRADRYEFRIRSNSGLVLMNLNQSFHPRWSLKFHQEWTDCVKKTYHLRSNFYAQAWLVQLRNTASCKSADMTGIIQFD